MRRCLYILVAVLAISSCRNVRADRFEDCMPPIWPDYVDVTVPYNIAPLDFGAKPDVRCKTIAVKVSGPDGKLLLSSRGRYASFGLRKWHRVLAAVAGKDMELEVAMKADGLWTSYKPFEIHVSKDKIDYGLTYRLIPPGYQSFGHMGLYERNLENFRQRTLIDTRMIESGCVNCHSPNHCNPDDYSIHIRGKHSATIMHRDGATEYLNTKTDSTKGFFVYPYWHPSGKYIAYSVNSTRQSFYSASDRMLEVYDEWSDVIVYDTEAHEILRPSQTNRKDGFETMPAFSPDGKTLYFSVSKPGVLPMDNEKMMYSLCSVSFDPQTRTFGEQVDTLLSSYSLGKSFVMPRPSYDGRFILVTAADFGTFLINHKEADMWLYDLNTGEYGPAEKMNSDDVESFHNWSSDSEWAVVSSRRDDGLYTRLYIAHFNRENFSFDKAFLLPQKNPCTYYDALIYSYNTPDFTIKSVPFKVRKIRERLLSTDRVPVTVAN